MGLWYRELAASLFASIPTNLIAVLVDATPTTPRKMATMGMRMVAGGLSERFFAIIVVRF
jgi:hypothetical protein